MKIDDGFRRANDQPENAEALHAIAAEAFGALVGTRQISPFSSRPDGLTLEDAYRATPLVRQMYEAQGFKVVGRKIGFTNRTIWAQYGVYAPVWAHVFDGTAYDLANVETLPLASYSEPRIEPEILFGLGAAPSAEMDEIALSSCIAWVALGFEIVQSIFPGWKFAAADTVVANGVHGALLVGPRQPFAPRAAEWLHALSAFEIDLTCDGRVVTKAIRGMCSTGRSRRCGTLSGCWRAIPSIHRLGPARSSARVP